MERCDSCGKSVRDEDIVYVDHDWSNWDAMQEAYEPWIYCPKCAKE